MDTLGTIYGKPLVRGLDVAPEKALQRVKASVLRRLRDKLFQSTFSDRAKRAFSKAITVRVGKSSLRILATHPAFAFHLKGRRNRQMRWLTKARAPIPIITEEGELIFRSATPKSMEDGKWVHPGSQALDFIDLVKKEAKAQIRSAMVAELRKVARDAAKASKRRTSR